MITSCLLFIGFLLVIKQQTFNAQSFVTHCYDVNNYQHCLSTNDTQLTWQAAKDACVARNATLFTVTSLETQSMLKRFRADVATDYPLFGSAGTWINVWTATMDSFHWINGSTGAIEVDGQIEGNIVSRFAAIAFKYTGGTIDTKYVVYRACTWNDNYYYVCQFYAGVDCTGGFQRNSVCYKKYNDETVTWFTASNRCLSMGGSLATFNDLTTPNNDKNLTSWLNLTTTTKYWIALVRRWYITAAADGSIMDVQYTQWTATCPKGSDGATRCVLLTSPAAEWDDGVDYSTSARFTCQTITPIPSLSTTKSTTLPSTLRLASSLSSTKIPDKTEESGKNSVTNANSDPVQTGSVSKLSTPLQGSETTKSSSSSTTVGLAVGLGVPLAISIIVIAIFGICLRKLSQNAKNIKRAVPGGSSAEVVNSPPLYTSLSVPSTEGASPVYTQLQEAGRNGSDDVNNTRVEYEMVNDIK